MRQLSGDWINYRVLNSGEIFKNVFKIKDHSHTKILPERDLTRYCTTVLQHGKGTYSATN